MSDLFGALRDLRLPAGDYVVFGSGPLLVRGIIEAASDLDILCRDAAWDAVTALAVPRRHPRWGVELVELLDGKLSFGTIWGIGEVDPREVIDTAETIEGLPFARLRYVVAYKRAAGRPKDLEHLEALDRFESTGL